MESAVVAAIPAIILAMGGILKLVLNALDRVESRQEKFLGNHLSNSTTAQQELAQSINTHTAKSELEFLRLRTALKQAGYDISEPPNGT